MVPEHDLHWPLDLTIFAIISIAWAFGIVVDVLVHETTLLGLYSLNALIIGITFHARGAQVVLLLQAAIFAIFGAAILARRGWGLVVAVIYLAQAVLSRGVFALANLDRFQRNMQVRTAATEGALLTVLVLYLWIRSKPIVFGDSGE